MISPILSAPDADTIALDFGVFVAEHARTYRTRQCAIIAALRPHIASEVTTSKPCNSGPDKPKLAVEVTTPSQPEGSSSPHAPAAQTDGEDSPQAAPSVAPSSPETAASGEAAQAAAAGESPAPQAGETPAQPMGGEDVAPPDDTQRTQTLDAAAQGSTLAGETAGSAVGSGAPLTKREQIRLCHEEHPDWPANVVAEHLGLTMGSIWGAASILGIKFGSKAAYDAQQIAKTSQALRASAPAPERPRPPAALDTLDVLNRVRKPAAGVRFYLRDKAGNYVHQSLGADPTGQVMMTAKRVYAWFGTAAQLTAAAKKWPEMTSMRQVGPDQ